MRTWSHRNSLPSEQIRWYYQTREVGEVDFVIEGALGHVVPIEVKSGKKVRAHAALDRLMSVGEYKIPEAVVLSHENLCKEGRVPFTFQSI